MHTVHTPMRVHTPHSIRRRRCRRLLTRATAAAPPPLLPGVRSAICVPRPIPGLVSEHVLVETYEAGSSVAGFMKQPTPLNTHIVALGVDAFLKMLLVDNFLHTGAHRAVCTRVHGCVRHCMCAVCVPFMHLHALDGCLQ